MCPLSSLLEFAQNMLHSLAAHVRHDVHVHVVSLSTTLCDALSFSHDLIHLECTYVNNTIVDNNQHVVYQSKTYLENVGMKAKAWSTIVSTIPDNTEILFTDVDVVFLSDPFAYKRSSDTNWWFSNADAGCHSQSLINTGVFFTKKNKNTQNIFKATVEALEEGQSYDNTDQGAMHHVIQDMQIPYHMLPCDLFPNGNVAFGTTLETHPIAIHANWIVSSKTKKKCLLESGLWYPSNYTHMGAVTAKMHGQQIQDCVSKNYNATEIL